MHISVTIAAYITAPIALSYRKKKQINAKRGKIISSVKNSKGSSEKKIP